MMYVLVGLCAVSIVLNIALVSYAARLAHWADFWRGELERERSAVRPVKLRQKIPVEEYDLSTEEWDG